MKYNINVDFELKKVIEMKKMWFAFFLCPVLLWAAPKQIIVMIPDGTGHASLAVARDVRGEPLAIDTHLRGVMETRSQNNSVTDSAAAGTAMACGVRTYNSAIGVDPAGVPLRSISEWARKNGLAVGIVTTDLITGATPSAFSAHASVRSEAETIIEQQISSGFEVMMGGGANQLTPERKDYLRSKGYSLPTDAATLKTASGKIFGLFAPNLMTPEVTRRNNDTCTEPHLAEMTAKALEVLSQDPDGFFLMVEGAQVDKANHDHDLPRATYELLAFDDAVATVLKWREANPEAQVFIAPDHETGGITLLNEPKNDARREKILSVTTAQPAGIGPKDYFAHYSTTWHTGVDVFYATTVQNSKPVMKNSDILTLLTEQQPAHLQELTGKTEVREGISYLILEDGRALRANRDAVFVPKTGKWYAR